MITSNVIVTAPPGGSVPSARLTCAKPGRELASIIAITATHLEIVLMTFSWLRSWNANHRWHASDAGDVKRVAVCQRDAWVLTLQIIDDGVGVALQSGGESFQVEGCGVRRTAGGNDLIGLADF